MSIKRLSSSDKDFNEALAGLLRVDTQAQSDVRQQVADIIATVRQEGDVAMLRYSERFDQTSAKRLLELKIAPERWQEAWENLVPEMQQALTTAHQRIEAYAQQQRLEPWSYTEADGSVLGQKIEPLDSVGIYVPGGKAAYPSSVLMNAIPAKVAGVKRIVMVAPAPGGVANPLVLASAHLCQVDELWQIGGAHAVAALAYGTESLAAVDKITGPGNQYVAEAKRAVFGQVGIDMIAGPSEVVVFADDNANPDWVAADLFAQAEHDELAQSILVTTSATLAQAVEQSIAKLLPKQPRQAVISASLSNRGAIIVADNDEQAIAIINRIAPEHLELMLENATQYIERIKHAGAIFVGNHSNEVFGDYCAGPNHVLPTSGTARFASPLGVYDFQKRTSVMSLSRQGAKTLSPVADLLAQGEGLYAHALSARYRGGKDEC